MKTLLSTLGIILILGSGSFAQDFKFGALGGFNISHTRFMNLPDNLVDLFEVDPMIAFNFNGYAGYKSVGIWGISVEPGFTQKGALHKLNGETARFQLNYIHMPVLADIYLMDKLFISAGPEFGWMIHAKAKGDDYAVDITEFYDKRFELSVLMGLNYNLMKYIDVGIRYNHGLTYISKISYTDIMGIPTGESYKEYNQYYQFIVRFKI